MSISRIVGTRLKRKIRLLAQNPAYSASFLAFLKFSGFEIVGMHGAGGFSLVDETSMVLDDSAASDVSMGVQTLEIIADIARPAAIFGWRLREDFSPGTD